VKLAGAHGMDGIAVRTRAEVLPAISAAQRNGGGFLIDFQVEQEDSVYPMIAPGAALHQMIRRPTGPLVETAEDQ
jgi:acetolactate synthase-1/2/3 large subunit